MASSSDTTEGLSVYNHSTYGRNSAGISTLLSEFQTHLGKLRNAVVGYSSLSNLSGYYLIAYHTRQMWRGADADDFLKDLQETVDQISLNIMSLMNAAGTALNDDLKQFTEFQDKNVK